MAVLLCVALLAVAAPGAQAQTADACAGTEGAGRLTPDNEQWPNRDRIAALKTTHPELWAKVCADLPMPATPANDRPTLVSNLSEPRATPPSYASWQHNFTTDHRQVFTTGSNASGYVLESVDIEFAELSDPAIFSALRVVVAGQTLRPAAFAATTEPRAYRFEAPGTGVSLLPSTTYDVVIDSPRAISAGGLLVFTQASAAHGERGWTMDGGHNRRWDRTNWTGQTRRVKLRLNGSPRPAGASLVRIDVADTAEGSSMVVTATLPAAAPRVLSFHVEMRECDWSPPTTRGVRLYGHDAVAACQAQAPGDAFAREADFNMWHPDGSARAFIHIAAGQTSGTLELPAVSGDGAEGSEAIAFKVAPFGAATRAYVGHAGKFGSAWYHPSTPPDGWSGRNHALWVGRIHASTGGTPIGGSLVPDGAQVGQGRAQQSEPAIDAALVTAVRELAGQTQHGNAHVNRWRRVLIAFGLETYDGLTAITEAEARANAATYSSPLWPQIADVLAKLQAPDTPQDTPQDGGTTAQDGTADPPQDPPAGYTVDPQVVAAVKELASQTQHGTVHVNRWNRVLVAFGEHDGVGVTGGAMTLDEAEQNTKRYSSPVWNQVVAELTKLNAD